VIGVGTYLYVPGANIPISVADAKAVRDVLCDGNLCGYPLEQVTLLHDDGASREGIPAALDTLADSTEAENTVFLYYCGHGEYGTDGNYHLTIHDARVSGGKVAKGTRISEGELLDGLRGGGYVANKGGYVSAFGPYQHVCLSVKEAAARLHRMQEPELPVLRGVGPFPASLYRGATDLEAFDSGERLPEGTAARQVDPARSQRLFQNKVRTVTASGAGAVAVGRDVRDSTIVTGRDNVVIRDGVDTGGGGFVGRDEAVRGDEVHCDKVGGHEDQPGDIMDRHCH
jgi:hypothetical protein